MPHSQTSATPLSATTLRTFMPPGMLERLDADLESYPSAGRPGLIDELLKFIYLASARDRQAFVPIDQHVDAAWHACILHTKDYAAWCAALPGKRFIHHESTSFASYSAQVPPAQIIDEALGWITAYVAAFGGFRQPAAQHWVMVQFLMNHLALDLDQVNQLAQGDEIAVTLPDYPA